ncbi:hypothetical protein RI367_004726 [Sorochytrium milnesiophthora]
MLPPELTESILKYADISTLAALPYLPGLRARLKSYASSCVRSKDQEQHITIDCARSGWSAGIELLVEYGVSAIAWADVPLANLEALMLTSQTIRTLWCQQDNERYHRNLAALVCNIYATETDADNIVQWCCDRSRTFAQALGVELLRRGGTLDNLRSLWRHLGFYEDDRDLAIRFHWDGGSVGNNCLLPTFEEMYGSDTAGKAELCYLAVVFDNLEAFRRHYQPGIRVDPFRPDDEIALWLWEQEPRLGWCLNLATLAKKGLLSVLQVNPPDGRLDEVLLGAARGNQVHVLEWLQRVYQRICRLENVELVTGYAGLEAFKWLCMHTVARPGPRIFCLAAARGQLEVVQWLYETYPMARTPSALRTAKGHEQPAVFDWLLERFGDDPCFTQDELNSHRRYTLANALKSGDGVRVKQLLTLHHDLVCPYALLVYPIQTGNLALLQWLWPRVDTFTKAPKDLLDHAAAFGQLHVLQWLHEHTNATCSKAAMAQAAKIGRLDIVQFLHHRRTEGCSSAAMKRAAEGGHVDVLDWLHRNRTDGCPPGTADEAAGRGQLVVVKWFAANMPDDLTSAAMDLAAGGGYMDVVRWLHTNRSDGCTSQAMNDAAMGEHLPTMDFLHQHYPHPVSPTLMRRLASTDGCLPVIQWLHNHDYPGCTYSFVEDAQKHVCEWFKEHRPDPPEEEEEEVEEEEEEEEEEEVEVEVAEDA